MRPKDLETAFEGMDLDDVEDIGELEDLEDIDELEDIDIEDLENFDIDDLTDGLVNYENELMNKITEFEESRGSKAIYLGFFQQSIYGRLVHQFHKFIRRTGKYEKLDIILESGGGQLDASVKLANICRQYSDEFTVLVPFYAKSAATVIALSADDLYLGRAGELGPVDPQINHPIKDDMFLQALSIKDAVDFIEQDVSDEVIKEKLVDQLDTYWIGASQRAIDQAEEYLDDVINKGDADFVKELVENYKDHGYPIDRSRCDELGIPVQEEQEEIEQLLYDVQEAAVDLYYRDNLRYLMADSSEVKKEEIESVIPEGLSDELPVDLDELLGDGVEVPQTLNVDRGGR